MKAVYRVIFILGGREAAPAVGGGGGGGGVGGVVHMASVSLTVTALHNRTVTVDF